MKKLLVVLALSGTAHAQPVDVNPMAEVERLAKATQNQQLMAGFAAARALAPNITRKELLDAIGAVENLGDPARGIKLLEDRSRRFPEERMAREELARLHERAGNPRAAVPIWKEIKTRFGLTIEDAVSYARVLSLIGDQPAAYAVLKEMRPKVADPKGARPPESKPEPKRESVKTPPPEAEPSTLTFWIDLATLAWELDDGEEALLAYRKVWTADPTTPSAGARLMTLLADAGLIDEAIAVGREAYRLEKAPQHVLFVAGLLAKRAQWAEVKAALAAAEKDQAPLATREEYWLLRAESHAHLGFRDIARDAYRQALRLNPASVVVRAALLWDSIERGDLAALRAQIDEWKAAAPGEPLFWAPYAVGLDRLGRTREAIPYYEKQLRAAPLDYLWVLEYADASERLGNEKIAFRLRRHAFGRLRAEALVKAREPVKPGPRDTKLQQTHALLSRVLLGESEGERWLNQLLRSGPTDGELEEFAIAWYLSDDRLERARKHLLGGHKRRLETAAWKKHRLVLAVADGDRAEVEKALDHPGSEIDEEERIHALLYLEDDARAAAAIRAALDRREASAGEGARGPALAPSTGARMDTRSLTHDLREIAERHRTYARLGATYAYVDRLDVIGPDARAEHDWGSLRAFYLAAGRRISLKNDPTNALVLPEPRMEAELLGGLRRSSRRAVTELGAGFNYQQSEPAPRLELVDVRQWSKVFASALEVRANGRIEDTSLLRIIGLRDQLLLDVHAALTQRLYLTGELLFQEDHSRRFQFVGMEAGGSLEAGYRIFTRVPEVAVGVRAGGYTRHNVSDTRMTQIVPSHVAVDPDDFDSVLPPSFQIVSAVAHLTRGDFFERQRQERVPFPRYDCDAALGYIFSPSGSGPAGHARCAASVRLPTRGYLSGILYYVTGVAGLVEVANAQATLAYTQLLY